MTNDGILQARFDQRAERRKRLAGLIGYGVHTALQKDTNSAKAVEAYNAISKMPDDEWKLICEIVADDILEAI